ncbi:MAG: glycosyltransferase [Bacteroidales bacterium]|nr:glycosyltransferase [Bacteroidales bacterium]
MEIDYFADNKPSPFIRIPYLFFIRKTEQEALRMSHLNLTLTNQDKSRLEKLYFYGHVTDPIQQLGVYEKISLHNDYRFYGSNSQSNEKVVFVMTGSLSFIQSDKSIRNFLNVYLPCIEKKISNYELLIGGSDPSMKLIEYVSKYPNIRLIADPVDLSEIVEMGDIYLCPVEMGSGMKLRIMDGLKAGLPVITHKVSGKGYEAFIKNGVMFEYDSVNSFNQSVPKALSVKINRSQIKDLYVKTFSLESGKRRLEDILKQQLPTE